MRIPALLLLLLASLSAPAQVRISQIYGGGGNAGATLRNDFVELYNAGGSAASLAGWSVQYASANGVNWQVTNLSGSIPAGGYYLVQQSLGAGGTLNLPAADASGSIAMSATAGKVALVSNTTALSGGTSGAGNNSCPTVNTAAIVELVGFGATATCYTGSGGTLVSTGAGGPTPAPSNTTAVLRAANGCTSGGGNGADFTATINVAPRNTTSSGPSCSGANSNPSAGGSATERPANVGDPITLAAMLSSGTTTASTGVAIQCDATSIGGSATLGLGTVTDNRFTVTYSLPGALANGTYDLPCSGSDAQARTFTFKTRVVVQGAAAPFQTISAINGSGVASPLAGQSVRTRGVVTGLRPNSGSVRGFYIESQTADRDADANTSEGLLVFTGGSAPPVCAVVGNLIEIEGTVLDFLPSSSPAGSVPLTELSSPGACTALGAGVLPAAATLTTANLAAGGSATQARKFLSMRVAIPSATVVGPNLGNVLEANATSTANGQFFVTLPGVSRPFRGAGILATRRPADAAGTIPSWNGSPEVLRVNTTGLAGGTTYEVAEGSTISNLSGIMDFSTAQSQYQVYTDAAGAGTPSPAAPTKTATPVPVALATDLTVGAFNMERFFNDIAEGNGAVTLTSAAYAGRLNKASLAIRNVMRMPDVLALAEVEAPRLNVNPQVFPVIQDLANKINSDAIGGGQGNPNYTWCMYGTNDVGGIGVAFLFKQGKVALQDCVQYGAARQYTEPAGGLATLNDRPPVVLRVTATAPNSDASLPIRIVVNHLRSLGGIDEPGAANGDRVRTKRNEQAIYLAKLIAGQLGAEQPNNWNATDNLVALGDFNAFQFNDGYVDVMGCITGIPSPANTQYFTAAQLTATAPCGVIPSPALINLTTVDPANLYSYTFSGAAQTIDHTLVNAKVLPRVRQIAYARNNSEFGEGATYRSNFNRSERLSDHDMPVLYLKLPVGVSNRTAVVASALVLNRATGRYNGTIRIKNTGAAALNGPIFVFFKNLPAGVTLPDLPVYEGVPYATINLAGPLAPGATSNGAAISFANPANTRISYTTTRFDGSF